MPSWEKCQKVISKGLTKIDNAPIGSNVDLQYIGHDTLPVFGYAKVVKAGDKTLHIGLPLKTGNIFSSDHYVGSLVAYLFQKNGYDVESGFFIDDTDDMVGSFNIKPMAEWGPSLETDIRRYHDVLTKQDEPLPNYKYCIKCWGKDQCAYFDPSASLLDIGEDLRMINRV